jgi:FkbM family methyltransferase
MKSVVKRTLRTLGLQPSQSQALPYEYLKNNPRHEEITVQLLEKEFKIADSLSFYWSFREIFLAETYKFYSSNQCPVILDCGSNYGTSIVYFKSLYPEAKIVAVEADPKIFQLLEWNIKHRSYNDITLINKAVSASTMPITFYHEGADGNRTFPLEKSKGIFNIQTIHLDDLIDEHIDFLKMDIEGSETEVICSSEKLRDVTQLFIEYHSFKDSDQTLQSILEKLSSNGFRYYIHTQFCSPHPLTEDRLQLGMDLQLNIFAIKAAVLQIRT